MGGVVCPLSDYYSSHQLLRMGCVSGRDHMSVLRPVYLRDRGSGRKDNLFY